MENENQSLLQQVKAISCNLQKINKRLSTFENLESRNDEKIDSLRMELNSRIDNISFRLESIHRTLANNGCL